MVRSSLPGIALTNRTKEVPRLAAAHASTNAKAAMGSDREFTLASLFNLDDEGVGAAHGGRRHRQHSVAEAGLDAKST